MALQYSTTIRNNQLDQVESTTGTSAILYIRTGAVEANAAAADTGTVLVTITLPSDWMSNAAAGVKSLLGTWQANASAAGTAGHFRIKDSGATTVHIQGTITATGGGGDMTLDNTNIANNQQVTITSFTLTAGNA
jgi:hypothetical protein